MAHKKQAVRLATAATPQVVVSASSSSAINRSCRATSSFVSAARNGMRARMSAWAKTIPSLPRPMAASDSLRGKAELSYRSYRPKRPQSKRRERNEGAPAGITPTRRIKTPNRPQKAKLQIRNDRGGGMSTSPSSFLGPEEGPTGSEQDDVSRPHP